ncbi:MAG: LpxI family protein [Sedimentitalea sp.]
MLALIAGQGALPGLVAQSQAHAPLICGYAGLELSTGVPDLTFRLETLGTLLKTLHDNGVTQVCFAGAIARPTLDPGALDAATLPLVPAFQKALQQGDDGGLRAVLAIFEQAGFEVIAAHDLVPDVLPQPGALGARLPEARDDADVARGFDILAIMGAADVGQGCVVQGRQAIALEGRFGTDWMLGTLRERPDGITGGVLVKAAKPGQDRRVDLPAIGLGTVHAAAAAGLNGIAIEAGGVMILERDAVRAACDATGLFLSVHAV